MPERGDVLAVICGHSLLDYCPMINGIYSVHINSASYQWVGGANTHNSYPPEVHENARSLASTCPYRDPLWAMLTIDPARRTLQIEGRSTQWVGPSPVQCGADPDEYWGWDPAYSQPRISPWRLPLADAGDLGDQSSRP